MIVDMRSLDSTWALAQATALDADLFGEDAWSADEIAGEFHAPDRAYLADVIDERQCSEQEISGNERAKRDITNPESAAGDTLKTRQNPDTSTLLMRGYAGMWCAQGEAEVLTVDVARNHQRQGVGERLLRTLLDEARRRGARRMLLQVRVGNEPAIGLYGKLGFKRIGTLKDYYGPRNGDAYELALDLAPRPVGFSSSSAGSPARRPVRREMTR
ncbi:GNAT family N-acetyltransferase [Bifidobacterium sp. ESL0790]|uniref:GNAT family N-acetyltransferase n=1 Tax=Bifidobacterium sp. ESL0790 TaxID=2983233 RepID=UPI0023F764C0|nr:GNAT family N-acetyltransferase [Bifidobacterium sp. ESL0790]WEV71764.1 GNAT family N-acetyltransferase [Bifidobacterium sp. ESL0790]